MSENVVEVDIQESLEKVKFMAKLAQSAIAREYAYVEAKVANEEDISVEEFLATLLKCEKLLEVIKRVNEYEG